MGTHDAVSYTHLPAGPFPPAERGERPAGGGISISLPLHPLLKNDQSGGLRPPYWMYPPGLEVAQPPGGVSKDGGTTVPPLWPFSRGGVSGRGKFGIPRPDPFFPAAFFGKKAVLPEAHCLLLLSLIHI